MSEGLASLPEESRVEALEFPQFEARFCEDVVAERKGCFFAAKVIRAQDKFNDEQVVTLWGSDLQKLHAKHSPIDKLRGQIKKKLL